MRRKIKIIYEELACCLFFNVILTLFSIYGYIDSINFRHKYLIEFKSLLSNESLSSKIYHCMIISNDPHFGFQLLMTISIVILLVGNLYFSLYSLKENFHYVYDGCVNNKKRVQYFCIIIFLVILLFVGYQLFHWGAILLYVSVILTINYKFTD